MIKKLNKSFVSSILINSNVIKQILELYLSLGRIKSAEEVCRTDVIMPAMKSVLNETYLGNCKDGLNELYNHCYRFLQEDLKHLFQAAAEQNNEYNFYYIYIIYYYKVFLLKIDTCLQKLHIK